jgi:hypothetical protein
VDEEFPDIWIVGGCAHVIDPFSDQPGYTTFDDRITVMLNE